MSILILVGLGVFAGHLSANPVVVGFTGERFGVCDDAIYYSSLEDEKEWRKVAMSYIYSNYKLGHDGFYYFACTDDIAEMMASVLEELYFNVAKSVTARDRFMSLLVGVDRRIKMSLLTRLKIRGEDVRKMTYRDFKDGEVQYLNKMSFSDQRSYFMTGMESLYDKSTDKHVPTSDMALLSMRTLDVDLRRVKPSYSAFMHIYGSVLKAYSYSALDDEQFCQISTLMHANNILGVPMYEAVSPKLAGGQIRDMIRYLERCDPSSYSIGYNARTRYIGVGYQSQFFDYQSVDKILDFMLDDLSKSKHIKRNLDLFNLSVALAGEARTEKTIRFRCLLKGVMLEVAGISDGDSGLSFDVGSENYSRVSSALITAYAINKNDYPAENKRIINPFFLSDLMSESCAD